MKILTKPIEKKLKENFEIVEKAVKDNKEIPRLIPPLKLFGGSTDILILWVDFENDICFGIFNLGLGSNDIGSNVWSDVLDLTNRSKYLFKAIERERNFKTNLTINECYNMINSKGWSYINEQ